MASLINKGALEKVTWKQIRQKFSSVNKELAKIIDKISPGDKYWIAKASYPYGSYVLKKALLMLPNKKGELVSIIDSSLDTDIRDGLNYNQNSNPVSMCLKNSFEIFLPLEDRVIPLSGLINPGIAFGAWQILNPNKSQQPLFVWDMTAGGRSVFMLPKISELKKHRKLKKTYNLNVDAPKSLMGDWEIFRQIANHPSFEKPWAAEILYFSKQWFNHLADKEWKDFYHYFHDSAWSATELWRNQFIWTLIFSLILKDYETRPNAYIMDTIKYLIYAGMGAFPAFAPAKNTNAGPFDLIQDIYVNEYELKNYPPIIMQLDTFDLYNHKGSPIYYSLQFPNASEFKPSSRVRTSIISDLHEIRSLMIRHKQELLSNKFNIDGTTLSDVFRFTEYDYFHNGVELHAGMRNSSEMPDEDVSLLTTLDGKVHQNFPDTCSFVKGCIRISNKRKT